MREKVSKKSAVLGLIFFVLLLLALVALAVIHLVAVYIYEENVVTASGRQHMDVDVFYLPNDVFGGNPIPRNNDFLISYTDFIEVRNSFTANFSEEMDIEYSYSAEQRFVLRNIGSGNGNGNGTSGGRAVEIKTFPLSEEVTGSLRADSLHFSAINGAPGGTYTIFPKEHIHLYFEFVEDQVRQMHAENVVARGLRGFTADLIIEFTYNISVPEHGINETVTQAYMIPLTSEIFTFYTMGNSHFSWQSPPASGPAAITLPIAVLYAIAAIIALYGVLRNIKKLKADSDPYWFEVNGILEKYAQEIIVYDKPVDLSRHEPMLVDSFLELLKLAINLNKHIMAYKSEDRTEFVVIVDEFACMYVIDRYDDGERDDPTPPPRPARTTYNVDELHRELQAEQPVVIRDYTAE
jgi:hypothetical protein